MTNRKAQKHRFVTVSLATRASMTPQGELVRKKSCRAG
jgi:hypothetical protein